MHYKTDYHVQCTVPLALKTFTCMILIANGWSDFIIKIDLIEFVDRSRSSACSYTLHILATNDKDRMDQDNSQTKSGINYTIGNNCLHYHE